MKDSPRKFDDAITHSMAHHLLAVSELIDRSGYARVSDIARHLDLTRGSVSVSMHSIESAGLVRQDANRFYHLTDEGRRTVLSIRGRHRIVEQVLTEVLGCSPEHAHREGCRLEHLLEPGTSRRLLALLRLWREEKLHHRLGRKMDSICPDCTESSPEHCPCCELQCLESGQCPTQDVQEARRGR